ncbi:CHAD domain-containing protein [Agrobacterium tumefaciens]|nr:CHAD domain-containing protein [Agrobacterium tumefaciens]UXS89325.1 CHAD domain-containing protein [Agrobacterium tumefaciens]
MHNSESPSPDKLGEFFSVRSCIRNCQKPNRRFRTLAPRSGSLSDKRAAAYDSVIEALDSSRTRALTLDFTEWLHCGDHLSVSASKDVRECSATEFTGEALDKARKKLKKHGQDLAGSMMSIVMRLARMPRNFATQPNSSDLYSPGTGRATVQAFRGRYGGVAGPNRRSQ